MSVLDEVAAERARQDAKWGQQDHPDVRRGLESLHAADLQLVRNYYGIPAADVAKANCDDAAACGVCSYAHILVEEVAEAIEAAVTDTAELRAELVQVAAVAVAWVEAIDRRGGR